MSCFTLERLSELRDTISGAWGDETAERVWSQLQAIELSLDDDEHCTAHECQSLQQLKLGVSDAILARREGLKPNLATAQDALNSLALSVKSRTIDQDGRT